MPNIVNQILLDELERDFQQMGSCLVVAFDKLNPQQDIEIRSKLRESGVRYRVVRNRLANKAFSKISVDMSVALSGKCGIATAESEGAITAAKALKDYIAKSKNPPIQIVGGVIEGTTYVGPDAETIAELPDRPTVQTMLAQAVSGPARQLASVLAAVAGGMARCIQARVDQGGGAAEA